MQSVTSAGPLPQTSVEPLIRLDNVAKSFSLPDRKVFQAVKVTSLSIDKGDIFGLVGRSGAGKSTLLRLINLLERPDSGRVVVGGVELTSLNKAALRTARQGIGMIFQQFNLLQNANVFDNVAFPLRLHAGRSKRDVDARVRECLAMVGIADKADSHPAQLSGGQKQRVAIARALATAPAVLLCDEPTSALDAETTAELLVTLSDLNRTLGVTIVIVTHELGVVNTLCRRVAVVESGCVEEEFAVDDESYAPRSALGRELARMRSDAALLRAASARRAAHV